MIMIIVVVVVVIIIIIIIPGRADEEGAQRQRPGVVPQPAEVASEVHK